MIYYILPPIVIVVSLGLLVFFISRKSDAIEKEIKAAEEQEIEGTGKVIISKLHLFSLAFLEKLMLRIKLIFLKSYNQFDQWVHSVRSKRAQKREQLDSIEEAREEAEVRETVEKKIDIAPVKFRIPETLRRMTIPQEEEAKVAPMVSKRVVKPEIKKKKQNQMEEALIERIALNPRDIEAYERLGDYYLDQKNSEDALECFKQVLKLSPGNHKAKLKIKKLESNILGW